MNWHLFEIIWSDHDRSRQAICCSRIQAICRQHENHDQNDSRWDTSFNWNNKALSRFASSTVCNNNDWNFEYRLRNNFADDI